MVRNGDDKHSHYKHRSGANQLIKLFKLGVKPRNPYHREAMRRVTTEEEWNSLIEHDKEKYVNKKVIK